MLICIINHGTQGDMACSRYGEVKVHRVLVIKKIGVRTQNAGLERGSPFR